MTTIPEKVKIGAYTVTVRYVPHLMTDQQACGMYIPREKEIVIDPELCDQQQFGTFCHEIIEAFTEIYELHSLTDNHHDIVILGEALHAYLRDNKEVALPK